MLPKKQNKKQTVFTWFGIMTLKNNEVKVFNDDAFINIFCCKYVWGFTCYHQLALT